jgi:hypothetical protein
MPAALNNFRTTLADVTTTTTTVYTPPLGYATVVLLAQVSNNGNDTIQVTASIVRSSITTNLIKEASIPTNDAITVLTGRLILNYGDELQFASSDDTSAQLTLSYLETLVTGS